MSTSGSSSPPTPVLVVSLHDAHDRRARFAARAEGTSCAWSFVDACRGAVAPLVYDPATALRHHGRALQPGELGCYASHAKLWEALCDDPVHDQYIILEDDVIVDWRALELFGEHDFTAAGHHYVRLYSRKPAPFVQLVPNYLPRPTALIQITGKPFGTQGYVVTRTGARLLLDACRVVRRPIDDQMDRYWEHGIPSLALFPYPIMEETVLSTIGASRFGTGRMRHRQSPIMRYVDRFWIVRAKATIHGSILVHKVARKFFSVQGKGRKHGG